MRTEWTWSDHRVGTKEWKSHGIRTTITRMGGSWFKYRIYWYGDLVMQGKRQGVTDVVAHVNGWVESKLSRQRARMGHYAAIRASA